MSLILARRRLQWRPTPVAWLCLVLVATATISQVSIQASTAASNVPVVHLVVDVSGSMSGEKLDKAKAAITQTANALPDTTAVGLRTYSGSCNQSNVEPLVPIGTDNDEAVLAAADSLHAGGGTPTTAALKEGLDELLAYSSTGTKRLVLLTDGDTQCGISICDYIKSRSDLSGVQLSLYTVGLQVSSFAAADLTCAAEATGGRYFSADDPDDLVGALLSASGGGDPDPDGDGIPTDWETNGLRASDGSMIVNLPAMGADPRHKDVFLRVDSEAGAPFSAETERLLIEAYAKIPIENPDGTSGIRLHVVRGPQLSAATSDSFKRLSTVGTPKGPRVIVVGVEFRKVWDYWVASSRGQQSVFRYMANVRWDWANKGQADRTPGQMAVIRACHSRESFTCNIEPKFQAVTAMHELGHTLGLKHGGDASYPVAKPNYLSIMNPCYSQVQLGVPGAPANGLVYSSWGPDDLYSLNENSLIELDGVKPRPGVTMPKGMQASLCRAGEVKSAGLGRGLDWNRDGMVYGTVSAEISTKESGNAKSILHPFDDIPAIQFGTGNIGNPNLTYIPGDGVFEF